MVGQVSFLQSHRLNCTPACSLTVHSGRQDFSASCSYQVHNSCLSTQRHTQRGLQQHNHSSQACQVGRPRHLRLHSVVPHTERLSVSTRAAAAAQQVDTVAELHRWLIESKGLPPQLLEPRVGLGYVTLRSVREGEVCHPHPFSSSPVIVQEEGLAVRGSAWFAALPLFAQQCWVCRETLWQGAHANQTPADKAAGCWDQRV